MPKLGDITLDVVKVEDRDKKIKTTDKPIEDGLTIVDHVQKEPVTLKLSGVCTGDDAATRFAKLEKYATDGERLTYIGRYTLKNALITSISTTKDVDVSGTAYKFDIELKQAQIVSAKTYTIVATKPPTNGGKQQPVTSGPAQRTYVVVRGDSLWKIAQKFYGSNKGSLFTLIYNANKAVVGSNPNLIYAGQKLIIP